MERNCLADKSLFDGLTFLGNTLLILEKDLEVFESKNQLDARLKSIFLYYISVVKKLKKYIESDVYRNDTNPEYLFYAAEKAAIKNKQNDSGLKPYYDLINICSLIYQYNKLSIIYSNNINKVKNAGQKMLQEIMMHDACELYNAETMFKFPKQPIESHSESFLAFRSGFLSRWLGY